ncbi:hemicentin-1-like [Zerene cesonia]|uniref:hemicentin-1-like n=1 Tax=Zerene cesonia TaxID=33412 RepID=UPI0018E4F1E0|nr:hemicentin-1-like [Zerene cesonia]
MREHTIYATCRCIAFKMILKHNICGTIVLFILIQAVDSEVKGSLTFVIDDTGSMDPEIRKLILKSRQVFEAVLKSNSPAIENFVLVTFNDPVAQFRVKTTIADEFIAALNKIEAEGGGECPEAAMKGIALGIKSSNLNSFVYVITDASADDYENYENVLLLAARLSTQVTFLLTGHCGCVTCENYKVYHKIANATGGQVFNMEKEEITNIIDYIIDSMKSTKCLVSHRHFYSEDQRKFELQFSVDDKLNEITLSLVGKNPQLKVFYSNGIEVITSVLVTLQDTLILKVMNIVKGDYIAKVEVNGNEADLSINAVCSFTFRYGFSRIPASSMARTNHRPTSGEKEYLLIEITKQDDEVELHTVQISDLVGNIIMNLKLKQVKDKFYVTEDFVSPDQIFKIAVVGKVKSTNQEITRVARATVEPAKVISVTKSTTQGTTSTTEASISRAPSIEEIKIVKSDTICLYAYKMQPSPLDSNMTTFSYDHHYGDVILQLVRDTRFQGICHQPSLR